MANRYWVGGTATWDATAGTKWATTSGGAGGAAVPGTGDDVFFDAASGAVTVTSSAAQSVQSLDFNGFTGTFNWTNNNITINGTAAAVRFSSGMTLTASSSRQIICANTSGTVTLTTNGQTIGALTRSGVGGTTVLADALTTAGTINTTGGTFDTANFNITVGSNFSGSGSTRTFNLGTSVITLTSASASVSLSGGGATYNVSSSSFVYTSTANGTRNWSGGIGGTQVPVASITLPDVTGSCLFTASNMNPTDLVVGAGWHLQLNSNNNSFGNPPTLKGTVEHPIVINPNSIGTQSTLTMTSGVVDGEWLIIRDINATGGATFNAANSFDFGNNTGWNITPPSGGGSGLHAYVTIA